MADETTGQRVRGLPKPGLPPGRAAGEAAGALVVPDPDNTDNKLMRDVIGNKSDAAVLAPSSTATMMAYIKGLLGAIVPDLSGLVFSGTLDVGMTASKTDLYSLDLAGYGNDYFNTKYYIQIIKNANAVGTAPETEVRKITDYVSTTGKFVCDAFSANVEASDEIIIMHESLVVLGRNDSDNTIDTAEVHSNPDGSMLERDEFIQNVLKANPVGPFNRVLFVDPNGNDTTGDGSWDAPFLTIPKAISFGGAMDAIIVKPGKYSVSTTIIPGQIQIIGCGRCTNIEGSVSPIFRTIGQNSVLKDMLLTQTGVTQIDGVDIRGRYNYIQGLLYKGYGSFVTSPASVGAYSENFDATTPPAIPESWFVTGGTITTTTNPNSAPNCLVLPSLPTTTIHSSARLERTIPGGQPLTFSIRNEGNACAIYVKEDVGYIHNQVEHRYAVKIEFTGGRIYVNGVDKGAITDNAYHTFVFTPNLTAQTFVLTLDGAPFVTGSFAYPQTSLNCLYFYIPTYSSGPTSYTRIDDVSITGTLTPEYNDILDNEVECYADFPAIDLDSDHNTALRNKIKHTATTAIGINLAGNNNYLEGNTLNPTANVTSGITATGVNNTYIRNNFGRLVLTHITDATSEPIIVPNYIGAVASSRAMAEVGDTTSKFSITGGGGFQSINGFYNNMYVRFTSGANIGQVRQISIHFYDILFGTHTITVYDAFSAIPALNDRFDIIPDYDAGGYVTSELSSHALEQSTILSELQSALAERDTDHSDIVSEIASHALEQSAILGSPLYSISSDIGATDCYTGSIGGELVLIESEIASHVLQQSTPESRIESSTDQISSLYSYIQSAMLASVANPLDSHALATTTGISRIQSATDQISSLYSYTQSAMLASVADPLDSHALAVTTGISRIESSTDPLDVDISNLQSSADGGYTNVTSEIASHALESESGMTSHALAMTIGVSEVLSETASHVLSQSTTLSEVQSSFVKVAGTATGSSLTGNWNAAEADVISIGANDTKNKIHSLFISLNALTAGALITLRMYKQVNGSERKFFEDIYTVGTDPDGVALINGTIGVSEVIRVTAQSNTAADDGKAIAYDFMMEAM